MPNSDVIITSDEHAQRIAREWQSPGSIGHVLAALASGIVVNRGALWLDVDTTLHHDNPTGRDRAELLALQDWADHARSPLLTNLDADDLDNLRLARRATMRRYL